MSKFTNEKKSVKKQISRGGEIGKHDGFKIHCQQWLEGSSPSSGTKILNIKLTEKILRLIITIMYIDTHAHLNFNAFKEDSSEIIEKCLTDNIWMINVGTQYITSKRAVEMAKKHEQGVYAAIGLHPMSLETGLVKIKADPNETEERIGEKQFDYEKYKELAVKNVNNGGKVVAIGEIGLDYYWRPKTQIRKKLFKQKQKELLLEQLKLAKELNLPVIFHCRMAHQDLVDILKENKELIPEKAVAHGFVGTTEELEQYLEFGFSVGLNGIIFKNIEGINFKENIKKIPLEKILLETDCPYLTPSPFEGERNTPLNLKYIAQRVAETKNIRPEILVEAATNNAKNLFGI